MFSNVNATHSQLYNMNESFLAICNSMVIWGPNCLSKLVLFGSFPCRCEVHELGRDPSPLLRSPDSPPSLWWILDRTKINALILLRDLLEAVRTEPIIRRSSTQKLRSRWWHVPHRLRPRSLPTPFQIKTYQVVDDVISSDDRGFGRSCRIDGSWPMIASAEAKSASFAAQSWCFKCAWRKPRR